jgi:predicted transcriptional regulator
MQSIKATAEKTSNWAGATPLFRLSAAQKGRGVAPALSRILRKPFFPPHARTHATSDRSSTTSCKQKGKHPMALVKAPSKQPKTTNVQVRLDEEVKRSLDRYAEFLDASPSYVVSEALKLVCRKDKEFQDWLSKHPQETKEANQGAISIP